MSKLSFLGLTYGAFLATIVLGVWLFKRLSSWNYLERFIAASLPVVGLICGHLIISECLDQVFWPINAARLAPIFALTYGYQLYYPADSGPLLSIIYGPLTAFSFLPTTLASSPTIAVIIGSFLAFFFYSVPILWLHIGQMWHTPQKLWIGIYGFIGFCLFTLHDPSLSYSAFRIHADAPALGFSAAACAVLYFRKHQDSFLPLLISAILVICAIWTKQVTIPLVVALPLYIFLADGWKCCQRYLLYLVTAGIIISGLLLLIFPANLVWFNLVTVPSHHPWTSPNKLVALLGGTRKLLQQSWLLIVIIFSYYLYCNFFLEKQWTMQQGREWLRDNRWIMLVLIGFFMLPTSVVGSVKLGGDVNTFSYSLYFFLAAATLIITEGSLGLNIKVYPPEPKIFKLLLIVMIFTFTLTEIPPAFPSLYRKIEGIYNNSTEKVYKYAKKHPGEAYFPVYPLSTLIAEGKLYHFNHGLFDRDKAGIPITREHFIAYLPAHLQYIIIPKGNANDEYVEKYLPEFNTRIQLDEFPDAAVYVRGKSNQTN
jgi:hypothetical protein